jgi:hypothetical protein
MKCLWIVSPWIIVGIGSTFLYDWQPEKDWKYFKKNATAVIAHAPKRGSAIVSTENQLTNQPINQLTN